MSEIDEMVAELEKLNLDDDAPSVADSVEVEPVIVEVKKKSELIRPAVIDPIITTPTELSKPAVPESNQSTPVVDKPSIDGIISSVLARKRQLIDEEAEQKKQKAEERLYDNLFKIIELASSDAEPTKPSMPEVKPVEVALPSKSNADAIALIDAEILNPKNKDLALLQKLKRQLQGIPEPKIVPKNEKVKKHNVSNSVSGKVAAAIIALFLVAGVGLSVGLKLMGVL